jgi:hypothetical protein
MPCGRTQLRTEEKKSTGRDVSITVKVPLDAPFIPLLLIPPAGLQ